MVQVTLPFGEDVPLRELKEMLLTRGGLSLSFDMDDDQENMLNNAETEADNMLLARMLKSSRILQLTEPEAYFLEDNEEGPYSPRNELQALSLLYTRLMAASQASVHQWKRMKLRDDAEVAEAEARRMGDPKAEVLDISPLDTDRKVCTEENDGKSEPSSCNGHGEIFKESRHRVERLKTKVLALLNEQGQESCDHSSVGMVSTVTSDVALHEWAKEQGVFSKIQAAVFTNTGRGAAAAEDIAVGDVVLEIPQDLLICVDTALQSEMRSVFESIEGLDEDTVALLWTMRERHNGRSRFAKYFASLPDTFGTGLSISAMELTELEGTLLLEEILQAREHLHMEYEALFPTLADNFPEFFPQDQFTWPHFLWAAELWYAYGIKVLFPNGSTKSCLVPMASLLNHSVCPHITNFSKLDPVSKTLRLRALRSCDRGKECYLSYGALPNSHLLMFYGFIPREPNPYDTIQIDLELPEDDDFADARRQLFEKYELTFSHALRASPRIPSKLLAALRVMSMDEEDFANFSQDGSNVMEPLSSHNEKAAIDCLLSMIGVFLNPLEYEAGEAIEEIPTGDEDKGPLVGIKAIRAFKRRQRDLLLTLQSGCRKVLENLLTD